MHRWIFVTFVKLLYFKSASETVDNCGNISLGHLDTGRFYRWNPYSQCLHTLHFLSEWVTGSILSLTMAVLGSLRQVDAIIDPSSLTGTWRK